VGKRKLTICGKTCIVNSLVVSKLIYDFHFYHILALISLKVSIKLFSILSGTQEIE
jgi:hypothetical protein